MVAMAWLERVLGTLWLTLARIPPPPDSSVFRVQAGQLILQRGNLRQVVDDDVRLVGMPCQIALVVGLSLIEALEPLFDSCGTKSYVEQSDTIFLFSPHNVFQAQWIFYSYHIEIFLLQRIRRCYFGNDLCAILSLGKTHLVEDEL